MIVLQYDKWNTTDYSTGLRSWDEVFPRNYKYIIAQ